MRIGFVARFLKFRKTRKVENPEYRARYEAHIQKRGEVVEYNHHGKFVAIYSASRCGSATTVRQSRLHTN